MRVIARPISDAIAALLDVINPRRRATDHPKAARTRERERIYECVWARYIEGNIMRHVARAAVCSMPVVLYFAAM